MRVKSSIAYAVMVGILFPVSVYAQAELTGPITHVRDRDTVEVGDIGANLIAQRLCGRCTRYESTGVYEETQSRAGSYMGAMPSYCSPI